MAKKFEGKPVNFVEMRRQLIYCQKEKNYKEAGEAAYLLGSALLKQKRTQKEIQEAMGFFHDAEKYASKLPLGEERSEMKYKAVRGIIEAACYTGNVRQRPRIVSKALQELAQKYDNEEFSLKIRQDIFFFMATTYSQHLTETEGYMDTALEYATRSLELLDSFEVKDGADFELCKISVTHVLANIYLDKDELQKAGQMCDEGLACQSIVNDPALHMVLLDIKRKTLSRENRLDCSLKMLEVYQAGLRSNKKEKFDVYISLGEDYITNKSFADAEKCYCEIFFDLACRNFDKSSFAVTHLIGLYKLNKCLEKCREMEADESIDPILMARMYEKVADFAAEKLWAHEFGIVYYTKMLQIAKNLDESFQPEKFDLIHDSLTSLAETFSDIHDFRQAITYYDELYQIAEGSYVAEEVLIDFKLNRAVKMINCNDLLFEEKEQALLDVFPSLAKDIHFEHYYDSYLKLLDIYGKQQTSTNQTIADLQNQYDKYEKAVAENEYASSQTSAPSFAVFDEIDTIPDKDIMKIVEQKRKNQIELERLKKRISHRNCAGESELHRAVKKHENGLEFAKLLIEKCGYGEIIDQQDHLGMTPLFYALMYQKYDIAKYYVQNGANVNISTTKTFPREDGSVIPSGQTPLMIAAAYGKAEMVQVLLNSGADPLMKDKTGTTANEHIAKYCRRVSDVSVNVSNDSNEVEFLEIVVAQNNAQNLQSPSTSHFDDSVISNQRCAGNVGAIEEQLDTVESSVNHNYRTSDVSKSDSKESSEVESLENVLIPNLQNSSTLNLDEPVFSNHEGAGNVCAVEEPYDTADNEVMQSSSAADGAANIDIFVDSPDGVGNLLGATKRPHSSASSSDETSSKKQKTGELPTTSSFDDNYYDGLNDINYNFNFGENEYIDFF